MPLGANMAVRRALIDRDRRLRSRARPQAATRCSARNRRSSSADRARPARAGCTSRRWGCSITCRRARLTKDYFRRWWYWKGVSKARLEQRHPITELGIDLRSVPTLAGVPRFMIGSAASRRAAAGSAHGSSETRSSGCAARSGFVTSLATFEGRTPGKWKSAPTRVSTAEKEFPQRQQHPPYTSDNLRATSQLRHAAHNWHPAGTPWTRELPHTDSSNSAAARLPSLRRTLGPVRVACLPRASAIHRFRTAGRR